MPMSSPKFISLYDLGAKDASHLDFTRKKLWSRMGMSMGKKAVATPVYLVSRAQMDYLAPPKRFCFLDPEWVAEWARRRRAEMREGKKASPLEGLDLQCEGPYRETVAVGLYRSEPPSPGDWKHVLTLSDEGFSWQAEAENPPSGPAIFLCPERILKRAHRVGTSVELSLDKVYYHELGHALMDTGSWDWYQEIWGRVVEESLANWIAFSCFTGEEARWVQRLIQDQPAEYRGYAHLGEALDSLTEWRKLPRRRLRHWYYEWEEWVEWVEWASRRGWPFPWFPFRGTGHRGDLSYVVYRSWRESKRREMGKEFWAAYAENLLLETFA